MSIQSFLSDLRTRDIHLWTDGERLRCSAPVGVLTPDLQDQLKQRKSEILEFLRAAESLNRQLRAIIPIQPHGSRAPVFAVPGHNGDVFAYREFAQHVGEDQPFFALHPPGLDGHSEPLASAQDLAAHFAKQIEALQGNQPCIIAGYCAGGAVALELACELVRRGVPVLFLALFACAYPTSYRFLPQIPYWCMRIVLHLRTVMKPSSFKERWQYLTERLSERLRAIRAESSPSGNDPLALAKFRFERAYAKAIFKYSPRSFSGRVCLFVPNKVWLRVGDEALRFRGGISGWRFVAPHLEEYCGPDGCDPDRMLLEPDASAIADLFRQCRDRNMNDTAP